VKLLVYSPLFAHFSNEKIWA